MAIAFSRSFKNLQLTGESGRKIVMMIAQMNVKPPRTMNKSLHGATAVCVCPMPYETTPVTIWKTVSVSLKVQKLMHVQKRDQRTRSRFGLAVLISYTTLP